MSKRYHDHGKARFKKYPWWQTSNSWCVNSNSWLLFSPSPYTYIDTSVNICLLTYYHFFIRLVCYQPLSFYTSSSFKAKVCPDGWFTFPCKWHEVIITRVTPNHWTNKSTSKVFFLSLLASDQRSLYIWWQLTDILLTLKNIPHWLWYHFTLIKSLTSKMMDPLCSWSLFPCMWWSH